MLQPHRKVSCLTFIHFFTWGGFEWQQKEDLEKALPGFSSSAAEKGDKTEGFDG